MEKSPLSSKRTDRSYGGSTSSNSTFVCATALLAIVKGKLAVVPPVVVTESEGVPGPVNVRNAVIVVEFTTRRLLTDTPAPMTLIIVAPSTKFVPVNVAVTKPFCGPVDGLMLVNVGAAEAFELMVIVR